MEPFENLPNHHHQPHFQKKYHHQQLENSQSKQNEIDFIIQFIIQYIITLHKLVEEFICLHSFLSERKRHSNKKKNNKTIKVLREMKKMQKELID